MLSGENASTAVCTGRGDAEHDAARPREQALRELERGVALADDEDAPALVLLGRLRRRVVGRGVEAGNRRGPRLRHPDREHADATAVLAVGRLEHEAGLVAPRREPLALVPNTNVSAHGELREPGLHLMAGRDVERAVHELAHERLLAGLVADKAVVVVPLVLARPGARTAHPASSS